VREGPVGNSFDDTQPTLEATVKSLNKTELVFEPGSERLLGVQMVSYAGAELIQLAALALRTNATAALLAAQLSVHPSHAERFIKFAAHEYHEVCQV